MRVQLCRKGWHQDMASGFQFVEREIGGRTLRIETGKLADLVVIDGDPLRDIQDSDAVSAVMLNGRLYNAKTLDETVTGDRETRPYYWIN